MDFASENLGIGHWRLTLNTKIFIFWSEKGNKQPKSLLIFEALLV